jgi:hypothetical protein
MHHEGIPTAASATPDPLSAALLSLLLDDAPTLWSLDELARILKTRAQATQGLPNLHEIESAVANLHGDGLLHRQGDFVFATRAAISAARCAHRS